MSIPAKFYVLFWAKYSVLAAGSGALVGCLFVVAYLHHIAFFSFAIAGLCLAQLTAFQYFWGKRRGAFEYAYLEYSLRKATRQFIIQRIGLKEFYRLS